MFFYTGKGDRGCSVVGKKKYPKDSPILETLGELDELNSFIGIAKSYCKRKQLSKKLQNVQEALFIIQARIAWFLYPKFTPPELKEEKIKSLEREIESTEKTIKPERGFIVSGSNAVSAWLDALRAVSRRVERKIFTLSRPNGGQAKKRKIPQEILTYLNRLSSYFYALARFEAYKQKIKEPRPKYK